MSDQQATRRSPRAGATRSGGRGKAETRDRLTDAARRLLASSAGDGLRVGDITAQAGVSHGTFYVYFTSVDDLLELLSHELADDLDRRVAASGEGLTGADATVAMANAYLPLYRTAARLAANLERASTRSSSRPMTSALLEQRLTARIVAAVERDPALPIAEVELVASALAGMVQQFAETWFGDSNGSPSINPDRASAVLEPLLRGALERASQEQPQAVEREGPDEWLSTTVQRSRNALVFGEREISYGDLHQRTGAAASWLHELGIRGGDRVALLLHNGIAPIELTLAAWQLGADVIPMDVHWQADVLTKVLTSSAPRAIAFDDGTRTIVDSLPAEATSEVVRIAVGQVGRENRYERELQRHLDQPPVERGDRVGGTIWFTSGTTDDPKGVRRPESVQERRRHARFMMGLCRIEEGSVFLLAGPIYHSANFVLGLATLAMGGTVVVMERFEPEAALRHIERWKVTAALLAPSMLSQILELPEELRRSVDLSSLTCVIHTGAPCPVDLKERALEYFGPVVYEWYATTEQGGTFITPEEWIEHPASVGRPWSPETEVRIFGDDHQVLPPDSVGFIGLRDRRRPPFHYEQHGAEVEPELVDGFFLTGDVGWLDDQGYLYLADRGADRILTDGTVVYPAEVEAVLNSLPGVADSAVVGVEDVELGQRVVAFVLPSDDSLDVRRLQAAVSARLAPYKRPQEWHLVDQLPRSASGKLSRRQLR